MGIKRIYGVMLSTAFLLAGSVSVPVLSEAQIAGPCSETVAKVCKDVIPGGGRIMKCLNDHRDDQSIACKDWVEDQQKSMRELMAVCPEEIAILCKSAPSDRASMYYCLLDNYAGLKVECRSKLGEIRDRLK